ncbi:hypothetical protein DdX_11781 [Ditylenchus destructor]|uniref:Saposin B-type domain-containing protein n=1 Tax=Ditylenchus destructor TaxID=166010 RepID=A0AAD4R452_9BILA|nr:hypothetical protein DdX_11781 [Ditylenchus destructor]
MKFAQVSNPVFRTLVVLVFCLWVCNGIGYARKYLSCDDCKKAMTRIAKVLGKGVKARDQFVKDYKKLIESEPTCNKDIACCSEDVDNCAKDIFSYARNEKNTYLYPEIACLVINSCDVKVEPVSTEPSKTETPV